MGVCFSPVKTRKQFELKCDGAPKKSWKVVQHFRMPDDDYCAFCPSSTSRSRAASSKNSISALCDSAHISSTSFLTAASGVDQQGPVEYRHFSGYATIRPLRVNVTLLRNL